MVDTRWAGPATETESVRELFLMRLRYKEGRLLPLEGNRVLVLDDPDSAYAVFMGTVDIFSVRTEEGEVISPRRHVARLDPGQMFFGMGRDADAVEMRLLASGVVETRVLRVPQAALRELAQEPEFADYVAATLDRWVTALSASIAMAIPPREPVQLEAKQRIELQPGQVVLPKEGVLWVRQTGGNSTLADRSDLPAISDAFAVPLSQVTWLRAVEPSVVEGVATPDMLRLDGIWDGLDRFHRIALLAIRSNLARNEGEERGRLQRKIEADQAVVGSTFAHIASLLNPAAEQPRAAGGMDALLSATQMVGRAMRLDLEAALRPLSGRTEPLTVYATARAAGIRAREVTLKGEWWRSDSGPLLGFIENSGQAVALLPTSPRAYALHDPVRGTVTAVTAVVASTLASTAYVFYRPFPNKKLSLRDLLRFGAVGSRRDLLTVLLMGTGTGVLGLATPLAMQRIFNDVIPASDRGQLLAIVFVLIAVGIASTLFQIARNIAVLRLQVKLDNSIQAALWDRLLSLPAPFFRRYSAGDLVSRAMGINAIRDLLSSTVTTAFLSALFSSFNLILLFVYDPLLGFVALVLLALSIGASILAGYFQVRYQRRVTEIQGRIAGLVLQIINGLAKFRIIGAEDRAFVLWAERFAEQRRLTYKARMVQNNLAVFNAAFPIITFLAIFAVVAMTHGGGLSTGTFIAFTTAFAQVLTNGLQVSGAALAAVVVVPLYERARPILEATQEFDETKSAPGELSGSIEVSHASFRYDADGPLVLDDVSIHVRPGEFVALVGPSGSGKSTLLRLLLGFEQPEVGGIYFDSQDLAGLDVREVRRQIGTVMQNGKLMTGSLLQNIIGSSLLTIDDAWEAARMAGIEEDIREMPMGMYTLVSEEGGTFSGGQRQRLMIARALVKHPRIIFFDEATSSLDNAAQEVVTASLDALHATRVVIAHRLSTIVHADRIYVLQNGQVVQSGTYDELMQQSGLFADLARRQIA
ncbi:MAG TPA: NHLP bacteriocin export ABC transporter permease/ATPase subunit [Chloroflexota bacterium]